MNVFMIQFLIYSLYKSLNKKLKKKNLIQNFTYDKSNFSSFFERIAEQRVRRLNKDLVIQKIALVQSQIPEFDLPEFVVGSVAVEFCSQPSPTKSPFLRRLNKSKQRTSSYRRQYLSSRRFPSLLLDQSQLSFVHNRRRLSQHFSYRQ